MAPTWIGLIGKGIGMGVVHVLTGPDHMSALATLSANGGCSSFKYGIRWGIGHSTGLIIVGIIMIALSSGEDKIDMPRGVSIFLESIVGIFMLLLGGYSLMKSYRRRKGLESVSQHSQVLEHNINDMDLESDDESNDEYLKNEIEMGNMPSIGKKATTTTIDHSHMHHHHHSIPLLENSEAMKSCGNWFLKVCCPLPICKTGVHNFMALLSTLKLPKQLLAFLIGVVHGVAGPGGVLGVIPAVHLHNATLATIYLATFCITSTFVMGSFASTYGMISQRVSNATSLDYQMELFSASLSIFVGILWLSLLATGKLHDVFP